MKTITNIDANVRTFTNDGASDVTANCMLVDKVFDGTVYFKLWITESRKLIGQKLNKKTGSSIVSVLTLQQDILTFFGHGNLANALYRATEISKANDTIMIN